MTISQIKKNSVSVLDFISGRIKRVWPQKTIESKTGAFKSQAFLLQDDTDTIYCTLSAHQVTLTQEHIGCDLEIKKNPRFDEKRGVTYENAPKVIEYKSERGGIEKMLRIPQGAILTLPNTDIEAPQDEPQQDYLLGLAQASLEQIEDGMISLKKVIEEIKRKQETPS